MSLLDYWGFQPPSVKRRKTTTTDGHVDSATVGQHYAGELHAIPLSEEANTQIALDGHIPSGGNFEAQIPPGSQTELESSLPDIRTDELSIKEYEAAHLKKRGDEQSGQSPDHRWRAVSRTEGRNSIYVDAFNLALETVLAEETHLFNEAEMEVFRQWRSLPYEAQYLYVRLFLRKTSAWHRIDRLVYTDITDLSRAVAELLLSRSLPTSSSTANDGVAETDLQNRSDNADSFRFADDAHGITTLEEASSLLFLEELKDIAKQSKVQGKTKKDLLEALARSSQTQASLSWSGNKKGCQRVGRDAHFLQRILHYTGDCIKLSSGPRTLFERVHLVYYRSTEWTEKSLTTIILAKISRKNFPNYVVCRSNSVFPTREILLEFEFALRTQYEIDNILQFNGTPTVPMLQRIGELSVNVYPRWRTLLEQERQKERDVYESGEGAYLRLFSPAWVYTRIIHKGLQPLGRFRDHTTEHGVLTELLGQALFHTSKRGIWYQRKALLEENYMWAVTPFEGRGEQAQRRHWKSIAARTCQEGLEDPECHLKYHYELQKRIMRLEKSLQVVKRERHDFGYAMLTKPEERAIRGVRVERQGSPGHNVSKADDSDTMSKRGRPTVWIDENGDGGECRVESMCLSWYKDNGWKGYHSEGGIVRTLFGYLFYDILFTYIPNVFQTPFQTCPLDLHTDAFYPSRASEINHRLVEITNGAAENIIRNVHARESEKQTCVIGIDWSFKLDDLVEITQCFRGEALAIICKILAQEYQQRGSGIPDLFCWNMGRKEVMFVEVKSEKDRLSDTQRLWIHILLGAGVRVELCHAIAREVKKV